MSNVYAGGEVVDYGPYEFDSGTSDASELSGIQEPFRAYPYGENVTFEELQRFSERLEGLQIKEPNKWKGGEIRRKDGKTMV